MARLNVRLARRRSGITLFVEDISDIAWRKLVSVERLRDGRCAMDISMGVGGLVLVFLGGQRYHS